MTLNKKIYHLFTFLMICLIFASCQDNSNKIAQDPINPQEPMNTKPNTDSLYNPEIDTNKVIPDFSFINQDGQTITQKDYIGKYQIADFFFTSCESICPMMNKNLASVYEKFKGNPKVKFASFSIDPETDTKMVLKQYANSLKASAPQWNFLTGKKGHIYELATSGYYAKVEKDTSDPQGVVHSGGLILVSPLGHVLKIYDGLSQESTQKLISDLEEKLK